MKIKTPRIKLPPDKLNTKLLGKMTSGAMPSAPDMPRLHLTGKDAKHFHHLKPGAKVSAHVKGTVQNIGMNEWNGNEPTTTIQLTHIKPRGKGDPEA